ncbi:MAG: flagellar hook-associated protein FlgK [Alphaproteobacteria bacterium]|nr:flagellar hook-associated protein FlgK [Alphaproteobacteria bacterium]MBU0797012.1 flagellar hook-associated protein FlgK [Alphaproteobacteria bacterium]MBU0886581.1 flagellar hook-associated protein FlgK [Alphaproteobacteria bacterium]MBU1814170.1 flagellar hook-associated protein FlgK [Alphaproteobacteria bacterium]
MSLNIALQNALSGLRVSQGGMDIVSRNIANANTEGYTRKIAEQLNVVYRGQGAGATLAEVRRQVDAGLRQELEKSTSLQARLQVVDSVLSELELSFGKPSENTSIAGKLNTLSNSFEQLYASPENLTAQQNVLSQAQNMIDGLSTMSEQVQELRERADADIATAVEETNAAMANIAKLNDDIARRLARGESTADLEDQRDIEVKKVAENIGIKYFERSDGKLVLMTDTSRYLVEYTDFALSFDPTAMVDPSSRYPGVLSGVTLNGVDITSEITSGKIGGLLELRDTRLVQAQGQLDEMAATMTEMFQGTGVELFMDNGVTFARGAGDVNVVGLSQRLTLNQDVVDEPWRLREGSDVVAVPAESANVGDTTIIESIIDAFNATRAFTTTEPGGLNLGVGTGVTLQSYTAGIVAFQGVERANTQAQLAFEQGLNLSLDQRLKNDSGVNIDEEIAILIQLQTSYAASARVVSSITQAFDELLGMVR